MTQSQAQAVFVDAFRGLRPRQKSRLLGHERRGTPILCGPDWNLFCRSDGAGSPETLAASSRLPHEDIGVLEVPLRWDRVLYQFFDTVGDVYLDALIDATPATVRAAIRQACGAHRG